MTEDRRRVAADLDVRSAGYSKNQWHRAYAEGLIAHSPIRLGDRVLDAGVGTGFAAIAAAARVGPSGRVVGVDVSPGMLQQAQVAIEAAGLQNIALVQADACHLRDLPADSFDAVVCSAALLYMPVQRALAEWRRLLRPGGAIGFSTMRAGLPQAGQLFRDCAAEFGVQLADPSAPLGNESSAAAALRQGGFAVIVLIYFGVVRSHRTLGFTMLAVLAALVIWTAPNRWGAGIALHYLSRVYWPEPADSIPPPPDPSSFVKPKR